MQIELTESDAKRVIFSLCYQYQITGNVGFIEASNIIATQTTMDDYFDGINTALAIEYPIPVEPPLDPLD